MKACGIAGMVRARVPKNRAKKVNKVLIAVSESLKRVWNISKKNVYSLSKAEISLLSAESHSSLW